MKPSELYAVSEEMRAFVACWVRDRRPPLPMVDFLLDHDMEAAASCVNYGATVEDRLVFFPVREELPGPCGLFPGLTFSWSFTITSNTVFANEVPYEAAGFTSDCHVQIEAKGYLNNSPAGAIVKLLDRWKNTKIFAPLVSG